MVEQFTYGIPQFGNSRFSGVLARNFTDRGTYFSIGFGFHYQSNDYRIVRIMHFGDVYMPLYVEKKPPRVEVYSLATNSWRTIGNNAGYYANDKFSSAFLNGAVHFFASKPEKNPLQMLSCCLILILRSLER